MLGQTLFRRIVQKSNLVRCASQVCNPFTYITKLSCSVPVQAMKKTATAGGTTADIPKPSIQDPSAKFFLGLSDELVPEGSKLTQAEKLKFLYKLSFNHVTSRGGRKYLADHGDSVVEAVKHAFPQHAWKEWLFDKVPQKFWQSPANQKRYLEWLGVEIGLARYEDWYNVKLKVLKEKGASRMVPRNSSLPELVIKAFPEHRWHIWKFQQVPSGFWADSANRKLVIDSMGAELGVTDLDQWHSITGAHIDRIGGKKLIRNIYGGSLCTALLSVYPNHSWEEWRFDKVPKGYWNSVENQKKYVDWAAKQLSIASPDQWYARSAADLEPIYGSTVLAMHSNQLHKLLVSVYPSRNWEAWRFPRSPAGEWTPKRRIKATMAPEGS